MRLTLDLQSELPDQLVNFCIYIAPQPMQFLILNGNQTLHQVNDKFWKVTLVHDFRLFIQNSILTFISL